MRPVSKPSLGRAAAGGGSPARAARSASFLLFCFSSPRFGLGREIIHPLLSCLRHSLPLTCLFPLYKIKHLHRLRYINLFPSSHKAAILAQGQLCYLIRPLTCTIPRQRKLLGIPLQISSSLLLQPSHQTQIPALAIPNQANTPREQSLQCLTTPRTAPLPWMASRRVRFVARDNTIPSFPPGRDNGANSSQCFTASRFPIPRHQWTS